MESLRLFLEHVSSHFGPSAIKSHLKPDANEDFKQFYVGKVISHLSCLNLKEIKVSTYMVAEWLAQLQKLFAGTINLHFTQEKKTLRQSRASICKGKHLGLLHEYYGKRTVSFFTSTTTATGSI